MARCDVCENEYDRPITVVQGARRGVFDSFECAIQAMAPRCAHCGCRVIGHGVQAGEVIYCCASCARTDLGAQAVADRS
ncbi:hypothetical protein [Brachybacterium subflavum]|uniref:hypothetical protein n=1 Tax=Brachybacterium subflavum TaxID=2585206 RepID=UPI001266541E|nr:hypothetical protein [Brachybacterium subflavum]